MKHPYDLDGWVATSPDWNEERAYCGATRDLALAMLADDLRATG